MPTIQDLQAAKQMVRSQLLQLGLGGHVLSRRPTISVAAAMANAGRNVHAVGIGRKIADSTETEERCVRIYVLQNLPESLLAPRDRLPVELDGVPTDIIQSDPAFILAKRTKTPRKAGRRRAAVAAAAAPACSTNRQERQRPVVAGISAGHRDITAGTLGTFCLSTAAGDDQSLTYALSNNHVFADVNKGLVGDPLYQPGPADGAAFADHVANLHRYVPITLGGTVANRVDAALGVLLPNVTAKREICSIGAIQSTLAAEEDMLVRKHGRTSGYTEGKIDDIAYDALVGMDHNNPNIVALFEDQIRVITTTSGPIGLGGDSGSALVHRTENRIVGLYFAGPPSGQYGVANKIENVVTELEIAF